MNKKRQQKLLYGFGLCLLLAVIISLILYSLRQNISLFFTPTEIAEGKSNAISQSKIKLGGMVAAGSLKRASEDLCISFQLTDYKNSIIVHYQGILPDLFREGQGVVVTGKLMTKDTFRADEILAKHDANYMPRELKNMAANQISSVNPLEKER